MINAIKVGSDFIKGFPYEELPEHISEHEGYYQFSKIKGQAYEASLKMPVRDFDYDSSPGRAEKVKKLAEEVEKQYSGSQIVVK